MPIVYTYSDIDIELTAQADGDIQQDTEFEAVKNSILNIICTMQGTRRMMPEFALGIHRMLFEPMDEMVAYRLGNDILAAIELWDDRVIIENININANFDNNQYELTISYGIKGSPAETHTIDYILTRE